jgi:uncharacterized RDD family membrane protein YckC
MQCAACLEVYPDAVACPRCQESETEATPAAAPLKQNPGATHRREAAPSAMIENSNVTTQTTQSPGNSTLIEFPGVNRNRPAWRKELSERFREIQQRRAREAAIEAEAELRLQGEVHVAAGPEAFDAAVVVSAKESEATKQLGLVPAPDEPEMNPLVLKALRRIERARAQTAPAPPVGRAGSARGHAATAAARVVEEQTEEESLNVPVPALVKPAAEKTAQAEAAQAERAEKIEKPPVGESARTAGLLVVSPKVTGELRTKTTGELRTPPAAEASAPAVAPSRKAEPAPPKSSVAAPQVSQAKESPAAAVASAEAASEAETASSPKPRKISGVIDDHWLERHGADPLPKVTAAEAGYDDRAPRTKRAAAALFDLLIVAFLCAPCAAVIELTIGDWSEPRVMGSMAGIVAVVIFLYHTCSVALASRTFGMKIFGLHAVDANKASVPTTWQCARRALFYLLSLATFGLGILYSLVDAEGRTVHDLLSGTVVVKE